MEDCESTRYKRSYSATDVGQPLLIRVPIASLGNVTLFGICIRYLFVLEIIIDN